LIAKWLLGNKNKWGWILHFISGIIWSVVALTNIKVAGGLLLIAIPSFVINIRNFIKWNREEYEKRI